MTLRDHIICLFSLLTVRDNTDIPSIFLSDTFHKVFHMFISPIFAFDLVIIVMCTNNVFWFCCLRHRLRACDVGRILVALFPYIMFVQIPGAFIWKTGRYDIETDQVNDWFYIEHDLVIWQNCYVNSRWSRELGQRYSSGIPRTKRKKLYFEVRNVRYYAK